MVVNYQSRNGTVCKLHIENKWEGHLHKCTFNMLFFFAGWRVGGWFQENPLLILDCKTPVTTDAPLRTSIFLKIVRNNCVFLIYFWCFHNTTEVLLVLLGILQVDGQRHLIQRDNCTSVMMHMSAYMHAYTRNSSRYQRQRSILKACMKSYLMRTPPV